jgi:hypothetical protein
VDHAGIDDDSVSFVKMTEDVAVGSRKGESFKDLVVWQRAMQLSVAVYKLTASFPASEQFGLTNQLRRAAVSVPSNIA